MFIIAIKAGFRIWSIKRIQKRCNHILLRGKAFYTKSISPDISVGHVENLGSTFQKPPTDALYRFLNYMDSADLLTSLGQITLSFDPYMPTPCYDVQPKTGSTGITRISRWSLSYALIYYVHSSFLIYLSHSCDIRCDDCFEMEQSAIIFKLLSHRWIIIVTWSPNKC